MKYTEACKKQPIQIQKTKDGSFTKQSGKKIFVTTEEFSWFLDYEGKKWEIIVPKWFETDFGSIPRVFWWLFDPTDWLAYILHDYFYHNGGKVPCDGEIQRFSRREADIILHEALITEGCGKISAFFIWLGVRMGGSFGWKTPKNNS